MKTMYGVAVVGLFCLAVSFPGFSQAAGKATHPTATKSQIAHGEYLVKGIAGCADCHTPKNDRGEPDPAQWLKGAKLAFAPLGPVPGWMGTAPDIAGLPGWSTGQVIHLLMTGLDPSGHHPRPPMPPYRMNRADASAVAAYLKSLR